MIPIAQMTFCRLRETAFLLLLGITGLLGWLFSDMSPLITQFGMGLYSKVFQLQDTSEFVVFSGTGIGFVLGLLVGAFFGATEIPREISSGQIYIVFSKPLSRTRYLLGKYFGVLGICVIFFAFFQTCSLLSLVFSEGGVLLSAAQFGRQIQVALGFIPFVAIVVMFSCFLGDISSIVITVLYLLFSMFFNMIPILIALLPPQFTGDMENPIFVSYYFFPNYLFYFLEYTPDGYISAILSIYSISVAVIFLSIASFRLNNMDINTKQ